jgi:hypothetical protein
MLDEILRAKGRLSEARRKRKALSLEGKGLVILLRDCLDPFEPDLVRLHIPEAGANMTRLVAIHTEMRALDAHIAELAEALGDGNG